MRPGEEELDGPPIHGNTRLEVIWTAIPSVIIAGLCAYAVVLLLDIQEAPAKGTRVVDVTGQQFAWSFQARDEAGHRIDTNRLVLPIGEPVEFRVHSKDVLHDFWVPAFRLKVDAVPGITTKYSLTPNKLGRFDVVCAELCGLGHAYMRQYVNVVTPERYRQWLVAARVGTATGAINTGTGAASGAATAAVDGKQIFVAGKPATGAIACGTCHTLKAAGTQRRERPEPRRGPEAGPGVGDPRSDRQPEQGSRQAVRQGPDARELQQGADRRRARRARDVHQEERDERMTRRTS